MGTVGQLFRFGIELELLIAKSKYHRKQQVKWFPFRKPLSAFRTEPTWESLTKEVSIRLKEAIVLNHINKINDAFMSNYREWSITQEATITPKDGHSKNSPDQP